MMIHSLSLIVEGIQSIIWPSRELEKQRYRTEMTKFLNQATDHKHLEYLEKEWEKMHGRGYW
jgi:hypothetical protein